MMPNRIEQLRSLLASEGWDALLISDQDNRYFASGYRADDHSGRSAGVLVVTPANAQLFTNGNNIDWARTAASDYEAVHTLPPGEKRFVKQSSPPAPGELESRAQRCRMIRSSASRSSFRASSL